MVFNWPNGTRRIPSDGFPDTGGGGGSLRGHTGNDLPLDDRQAPTEAREGTGDHPALARARVIRPHLRRGGAVKSCITCGVEPRRPDGAHKCLHCLKPRRGLHFTPVRQCWDCGRMHPGQLSRCASCHKARPIFNRRQTAAIRVVSAMVKGGFMPRASTLMCVDCGTNAQVYDHRDYDKPLEVEPVCRKCNARRGYTPQTRPNFGPLSQATSYYFRAGAQ